MSLFRTLGLLLLTMPGFSLGAVLGQGAEAASRGGVARPRLLDFGGIFLCWLGVLTSQFSGLGFGETAAVWTLAGFGLAFALHRLRKPPRDEARAHGITGAESARHTPSEAPGQSRHAWDKWKAFARAVGEFQSRIILTGLYYVALAPFGIVVGWLGDPLRIKSAEPGSYWKPKPPADENLDAARRQF